MKIDEFLKNKLEYVREYKTPNHLLQQKNESLDQYLKRLLLRKPYRKRSAPDLAVQRLE